MRRLFSMLSAQALACALLLTGSALLLSGCLTSTLPGADGISQIEDEEKRLEATVRENPSDVEAWAQLIDLRQRGLARASASSRRELAEEISETVQTMLGKNEDDYRAWLVAANYYRGMSDLTKTEIHLFGAHQRAEKIGITNEALAAFYRDVGLPEDEETYWIRYIEAVPGEPAAQRRGWIALINTWWKLGKFEAARDAINEHLPRDADGVLALRVRAALTLDGFDAALAEFMPADALADKQAGDSAAETDSKANADPATPEAAAHSPQALLQASYNAQLTPEASVVLLRMIPFAESAESLEVCENLSRIGLGQTENVQARMSFLLAMWEATILRAHLATQSADPDQRMDVPAGAREIAARIDEIDPTQRDWVVRRWMVASATQGAISSEEKIDMEGRLRRLNWPAPAAPANMHEVAAAWQVEDGLRLRLYSRAYAAAEYLHQSRPDEAAMLIVMAQIKLEARDPAAALELLSRDLLLKTRELDERRFSLSMMAWLMQGDPREVVKTQLAMYRRDMQPAPASRVYPKLGPDALRITALASFHAEKSGIELKDLIDDAE